jgi:hypothetical protein
LRNKKPLVLERNGKPFIQAQIIIWMVKSKDKSDKS